MVPVQVILQFPLARVPAASEAQMVSSMVECVSLDTQRAGQATLSSSHGDGVVHGSPTMRSSSPSR